MSSAGVRGGVLVALLAAGCSSEPASGPAKGSGGVSGAGTGGVSGAGGAAGVAGSAGRAGGGASCVSSGTLLEIDKPFSCQGKPIVTASLAQLPHDCHTQGIGISPDFQRFIITCQDQDGGSSGRVLSYPFEANGPGRWDATSALELFDDANTAHPSAIQVDALGQFLVAMAKGSASGPSYFHALTLADGGAVSEAAPTLTHGASHVGAVALASFADNTYAMGCGWDCATLSIYTAPGLNATTGFSQVVHGATSSFVTPGVDENVGAYNSLYLTRRCEDDRPLLFASHDDWLDVWELSGLGTPQFSMSKLLKRQIDEGVVLWQGRPIFYEGMTVELAGSELFVWAAPHDFGTESCPAGTRCMQYVYRCRFGG